MAVQEYSHASRLTGPIVPNPTIPADEAKPDTKKPKRKHPWTTTHSSFVVSGGFAVDIGGSDENKTFLPGSRHRVTLTQEAVLHLANHKRELIPDISEAVIRDKSKTNALAKTIVCIQATWFLTQCIVRLG